MRDLIRSSLILTKPNKCFLNLSKLEGCKIHAIMLGQWNLCRSLWADCHMFLINLVYRFFRFGIPRVSLDILGISFLMSLSLSEKPDITIANVLYLVFRTNIYSISLQSRVMRRIWICYCFVSLCMLCYVFFILICATQALQ